MGSLLVLAAAAVLYFAGPWFADQQTVGLIVGVLGAIYFVVELAIWLIALTAANRVRRW